MNILPKLFLGLLSLIFLSGCNIVFPGGYRINNVMGSGSDSSTSHHVHNRYPEILKKRRVVIAIANQSSRPVDIYGFFPDGKKELVYSTLRPGRSYREKEVYRGSTRKYRFGTVKFQAKSFERGVRIRGKHYLGVAEKSFHVPSGPEDYYERWVIMDYDLAPLGRGGCRNNWRDKSGRHGGRGHKGHHRHHGCGH